MLNGCPGIPVTPILSTLSARCVRSVPHPVCNNGRWVPCDWLVAGHMGHGVCPGGRQRAPHWVRRWVWKYSSVVRGHLLGGCVLSLPSCCRNYRVSDITKCTFFLCIMHFIFGTEIGLDQLVELGIDYAQIYRTNSYSVTGYDFYHISLALMSVTVILQ